MKLYKIKVGNHICEYVVANDFLHAVDKCVEIANEIIQENKLTILAEELITSIAEESKYAR